MTQIIEVCNPLLSCNVLCVVLERDRFEIFSEIVYLT